MPAAMTVSHLTKTYGGKAAVDDISFTVRPSELFGIVGPNGAGKTTTVECVIGLRQPTQGDIRVLGLDPHREGRALRERIGVQLQHAALPDRIKVWEAVELFAALYQRPANGEALIDTWGLAAKRDTQFTNLSGGQQQRLSIVLALINQPRLVVLDELTTGLDPEARRDTWDLVRSIREQGVTVILVSHSMDEVERLCDRVAVINHGQLAALDAPATLIAAVAPGFRVRFRQPAAPDFDAQALRSLPGVSEVGTQAGDIVVSGEGPVMAQVATALAARGIIPPDLRTEGATLEEAYLTLTGAAATGDTAAPTPTRTVAAA